MKRCACCKQLKDNSSFCKSRSRKDGLNAYCRTCTAAKDVEFRNTHPNYRRENHRRWYLANREKKLSQNKAWRKLHPEYEIWNKNFAKKWRKKNRVRVTKRWLAWVKNNPASVTEMRRRYRNRHPEQYRSSNSRRRALVRNAKCDGNSILRSWMRKMLSLKSVKCYWCKKVIKGERTVDHIIPLSKGGSHQISNFCVSCNSCNCSKGAKTPYEWANQGEFHL